MTLRLVVSCDSEPAAYAPQAGERCRGWLATDTIDPLTALADAVRAGWVAEKHPTLPRVVIVCPACVRARAARPPQEAAP